jgi:large subunit ribosomal protein L11
MAKAKKEIKANITLLVKGAAANPAPPLGPVLGQNGVNIQEFCTKFNEVTKDRAGDMLPVKLTVYKDGSFNMVIKQPTVASMLKKAAKIEKGSANPKTEKIGKVSRSQIREIAEKKLSDLNTKNINAASNTVEGTAKSLGLDIVD